MDGAVSGSVHVLVDLLGLAVLAEQATEDTLTSHPQNLVGHAGLARTVALTGTLVATLSLGGEPSARAGLRVHDRELLDDEAILDQAAHVLACRYRAIQQQQGQATTPQPPPRGEEQ